MNRTKRRIAVWSVSAVAVLGLAGCSSAPSGGDSSSDAPAAAPESNQSVTDACLNMAEPLQDASSQMMEIANLSSDPQAALDTWTAFTDSFGEIADSVENSEVKTAATDAHADLVLVRDVISKVYVDGDTAAVSELSDATSQMQDSFMALGELCSDAF